MELEITPEPDEADRAAIVAAMSEGPDLPAPYLTAWRRAALAEAADPDDGT